jgi:hypothetical protein
MEHEARQMLVPSFDLLFDKAEYIVGIDPAYTLGLSIYNKAERKFYVDTLTSDYKNTFQFLNYFKMSKDIINKFYIMPGNILFIFELPTPTGFTAQGLGIIDSLLINNFISMGSIIFAQPRRIGQLTNQHKKNKSLTKKYVSEIVEKNGFLVDKKRISNHVSDSMMLVLWVLYNKNNFNILDLNTDKWNHNFEILDNYGENYFLI